MFLKGSACTCRNGRVLDKGESLSTAGMWYRAISIDIKKSRTQTSTHLY
jgi:hypothetical protein